MWRLIEVGEEAFPQCDKRLALEVDGGDLMLGISRVDIPGRGGGAEQAIQQRRVVGGKIYSKSMRFACKSFDGKDAINERILVLLVCYGSVCSIAKGALPRVERTKFDEQIHVWSGIDIGE